MIEGAGEEGKWTKACGMLLGLGELGWSKGGQIS